MRQSLAFLLVLALALLSSRAEPVETIINNGNPQNRVDIAVLGDGYTASELDKYKNNVESFFAGFFNEEPFHEYQAYFNVHRIDVTSNQSGADHPERGVSVDTALDASYNCAGVQRLICVDTSKVDNIVAASLGPSQHDVVVVIVNDTAYGGSGGPVAVASIHQSAVELVMHEEGHSFGLLGDEYGGPPPPDCQKSLEPSWPNVTKETQRSLIKWSSWIASATPLPTTAATVALPGLYQGAGYCDQGLYRPTYSSKMRALNNPYEQVNTEQLVRRIYNFVSPLESSTPAADSVAVTHGLSQAFTANALHPLTHDVTIQWLVDGEEKGSGSTFFLDSASLSTGMHEVVAALSDGTAFVRSDPNQLLQARKHWTVAVNATSNTQLGNIATRLQVGTGDSVAIGGFIVSGTQSKKVIIRAKGPSLTQFGVAGVLQNPTLSLFGPAGFIMSNDDWKTTQRTEIEESGMAPTDDFESAIIGTLAPGNYTAIVGGSENSTGIALVEVFDLDPYASSSVSNISTRGLVQTGDSVMIGGLIVQGAQRLNVLARAKGPSLTAYGVPFVLADPTLTLYNAQGVPIASNDNWRDTQQPEISATGMPPDADAESAIVQTLDPGNYTAIVRGKNNSIGNALVELFSLP